uniref:Uncharacterized protein n=1 Tax=viral metagenome TaxID=1070528 RepID=A0A6M3LZ97_9ZZZZ
MTEKAVFKLDEEKKHSRRYKTTDPDFPTKTIYISRPFANGKDRFTITIEEKEG